MPKRTLLDISDDLLALEELLSERDGDVTDCADVVDEWFKEIEGDMNNKMDGYASLITELDGRAKIRQAEAARLSKRARIDGDSAKYLKERLKEFFQQHGLKKVETARYRLSLTNNGGKAPLDVMHGKVPEEFQRVIVETDVDKIRDALKKGELDFAKLLPRGQHIRIL